MRTKSFGLTAMVIICIAALFVLLGGLVVTARIAPLINPDGSVNTGAVVERLQKPEEPQEGR